MYADYQEIVRAQDMLSRAMAILEAQVGAARTAQIVAEVAQSQRIPVQIVGVRPEDFTTEHVET